MLISGWTISLMQMNPSSCVIYQPLFMGFVQIKGKTFKLKAAHKLTRLPITNDNMSPPIKAQCQKQCRPMRAEHMKYSFGNRSES